MRDDQTLATSTFVQIKTLLEQLSPCERFRVVLSLLDNEMREDACCNQMLANFLNDRLQSKMGLEKAVKYWRYLAETRKKYRFEPENWVTLENS